MSLKMSAKNHEDSWAELPSVRYSNKSFVNDNYLEAFEKDTSSNAFRIDQAEVERSWKAAQRIYEKARVTLKKGMHENGELDPNLIIPVLEDVLGFSRRKKKFTPPNHGSLIEPDHLLFESQNTAGKFWEEKGKESRDLSTITAICESKSWNQPLDERKSESDLSPHEQVLRDMRLTGAAYGILTNGNKWRLYSKDSLNKAAHYFEMSFPLICESEEPDNFELFYNFFSKAATATNNGASHISNIQNESLRYGAKLENTLRVRMFTAVEYLLSGLQRADENVDLDSHYKSAIQLMYRVLFILKAEDANLLPVRNASSLYQDKSLRAICDEATRLVTQWDLGKEEDAKSKFSLFDSLVKLSKVIDKGDPTWDIKIGFNGGLFSDVLRPNVFKTKISNESLANALFRCTRIATAEVAQPIRVNFDSINYQHIGSVYEGLLEFKPKLATKGLKVIANETKFDIIESKKSIPSGFELLRQVAKGDVYLEAKEEARKNSGSYYTPQWLVISSLSLCGFIESVNNCKSLDELKKITTCDPAMGSGHFLVDAAEFIIRKAQSLYVTGSDMTLDETTEEVLLHTLFGSDKNELAVLLAKLNIWIILGRKNRKLPNLDNNLKNGNSLMFNPETTTKNQKKYLQWFDWYKEFSHNGSFKGFRYLIGNPPWGGNIQDEKNCLNEIFPGVSPDNLNSFDLFIRQGERLISDEGVLAFVLPRNFIRTSDYTALRQHIGKKITFLADAGAAFDGVTQEAVVFGMKKQDQTTYTSYPHLKRFETSDRQKCFDNLTVSTDSISSPEFSFNPYWSESLSKLNLKQAAPTNLILKNIVSQSRGIEYGGNGEVGKCPHCSQYISRPKKKKKDYKNCDNCGKKVTLAELPAYYMISNKETAKHTTPVFSGRGIQKYHSKSPKYLQLKLAGIKYKKNLFDGTPTIFITKISDSIRCDIALNGEYVTQGVYTLKTKDKTIPLEWIAAVLNSEACRFFYEFRFNMGAKLTTNVLLDHLLNFKIPKPPEDTKELKNLIKKIKKQKPGSSDWTNTLESLDDIVFDAYGFKDKEISAIRTYLADIDDLKEVVTKQMKSLSADFNMTEMTFEEEQEDIDAEAS